MMKKIYLLVAFALVSYVTNAQTVLIDDNFDSYTLGDIVGQAPHWTLWPGGTSAQVSDEQAASGSQSMKVRNNTTDDMLLLLGDKTSGTYTVQWDMYLPTGAPGFYNFQELENVGATGNFAGQVFFGQSASGGLSGMITFDFSTEMIPYVSDTWITMKHVIDLDNSTIQIFMDGVEILNTGYVYTDPTTGTQTPVTRLGAIDFYSIDVTSTMYIDNLVYAEGILGTHDFSADTFSVYPNPMTDVLHIQSATAVDAVTVYDLLGKVVLQSAPGTISPSINTSSLTPGAYLVKITIGNSSKTLKVLK